MGDFDNAETAPVRWRHLPELELLLESCADIVYYHPHTTTLGVAVGVNNKKGLTVLVP